VLLTWRIGALATGREANSRDLHLPTMVVIEGAFGAARFADHGSDVEGAFWGFASGTGYCIVELGDVIYTQDSSCLMSMHRCTV
jgi:hypothetical protein